MIAILLTLYTVAARNRRRREQAFRYEYVRKQIVDHSRERPLCLEKVAFSKDRAAKDPEHAAIWLKRVDSWSKQAELEADVVRTYEAEEKETRPPAVGP
jgi:hypothetical protein